jgi:hypothetical protein
MTSYKLGVLVAVLSLLLGGTSAVGKSPSEFTGPSLCRPYESGSNGYSLRCPKRPDPYRGTNTGLRATYQTGNAASKQAEIFQDATSWLVHIPERVLPGDTVVTLSFLYAPSELARQALQSELQKFNETVLNDVSQALRMHGEDWTTQLAIDPNVNPYELLKTARSKDDTPAIPELLKGLGFAQDPASQKWKPTDKTLNLLNEAAQKSTEQGLLKMTMLNDARKSADVCSTLLSKPPAETPKELLEMAAECVKKVSSAAATESAKIIEVAAEDEKEKATSDSKACQQLFQPLFALSGFNEATSDDDIVKMSDALDKAQEEAEKVCPKGTVDQLASVASLLTLTRHVNAISQTEKALKAQLKEVAAIIAVNVDLPDSRDQLLQADAERRGYSLSSGAVYLFGLNDLVYPVSVSFCPVGGCLRAEEQFWFSWKSLGRSFSAEVGIAAVTADKFDDPRRRNGPGFLLGLSWQGLAPFRLSGGTLAFENQETRRWQFDGYLGLTLDAVKAIEMMGLFGVSVPVQLKSVGSNPSS